MGVPGAPSIERMRQPMTISASAKCARISLTDHLSGAGRLRSLEAGTRFIRRSSFFAAADCDFERSLPSMCPKIRCEYCCAVSVMSRISLREKLSRVDRILGTALLHVQNVVKSLFQRTVPGWMTALA